MLQTVAAHFISSIHSLISFINASFTHFMANEGKIWRRKGDLMMHVQFVEDPPSRGWIREKLTSIAIYQYK